MCYHRIRNKPSKKLDPDQIFVKKNPDPGQTFEKTDPDPTFEKKNPDPQPCFWTANRITVVRNPVPHLKLVLNFDRDSDLVLPSDRKLDSNPNLQVKGFVTQKTFCAKSNFIKHKFYLIWIMIFLCYWCFGFKSSYLY